MLCKTEQALNWARDNVDKAAQSNRKFRRIKRQDPYYRVCSSVSLGIWYWLKEKKDWFHWEDLVNFTKEELLEHLESQFDENMTWQNYGSYWHIDHIKPKSKCETFQEAWQLSNLQPLEASKNKSKKDKY